MQAEREGDVYARFGIEPVVNCVGYATRVGGSCPHPEVIAAMAEASTRYVEIDDVLRKAGELISRCTGAESGIVTAGAGAALTLAAAACLAGNDPEIMDQLPDVSQCARTEIIYPEPGAFDYDHAIRVSGAKLVTVDYKAGDALKRIEGAINERTAAVGTVWHGVDEKPRVENLATLAHRHGLPLIVDAAYSLPPVENLTSFIQRGADLVAFSGGKHIGGPQASGILCGRRDLIRSAWVQMVDMDVRGGTWSLEEWVKEGWISRPPRHGIGRSMKVSKESMLGLMTALERYSKRDHAAEIAGWQEAMGKIYQGLKDLTPLKWTLLKQAPTGQPHPLLMIESGEMRVRELILGLRTLKRKILTAEDEVLPERAYLAAHCLQPGDVEYIVSSIRGIVEEFGKRR